MNEVKLFSPATVANVSCGFDVLGFCLDAIGDEMIIRKTVEKGIKITKIEGYDLPFEVEKNVAGVSALALYHDANPDCGFEIEIYKYIKLKGNIGIFNSYVDHLMTNRKRPSFMRTEASSSVDANTVGGKFELNWQPFENLDIFSDSSSHRRSEYKKQLLVSNAKSSIYF